MKKIQLNKGLSLNKEAITKLGVRGVTCANASCAASCNQNSCNHQADQVLQ